MFAAMTDALAGNREPTSETLEVIRNFAEIDVRNISPHFCSDRGVAAVALKVLARHKDNLVGALCP